VFDDHASLEAGSGAHQGEQVGGDDDGALVFLRGFTLCSAGFQR
jgi:hypothetical protein